MQIPVEGNVVEDVAGAESITQVEILVEVVARKERRIVVVFALAAVKIVREVVR